MWVRFVLVPGLTDQADDIKRIAAFTADLGNVQRVDVLPFHQLGRYKWKDLAIPYELERTEPPTADAIEAAALLFRAEGLTAY
jgi:pyruvate formate lyase activating enzyme